MGLVVYFLFAKGLGDEGLVKCGVPEELDRRNRRG